MWASRIIITHPLGSPSLAALSVSHSDMLGPVMDVFMGVRVSPRRTQAHLCQPGLSFVVLTVLPLALPGIFVCLVGCFVCLFV